MSKRKEIFASIDIGSSKVLVLVAELTEGTFNILGLGYVNSSGVKDGNVVDIKSTTDDIKKAILEAENISGYEIEEIITGISGVGITSLNSKGSVSIRDDKVQDYDIMRSLQRAEEVLLPADKEILHTIKQCFIIDDSAEIKDPIGMYGNNLIANIHVIAKDKYSIKNIASSISQCDVDICQNVLNIIASSEALLGTDEKNGGVCVIDIGKDTTDIAIFCNGFIYHTETITIAGQSVTNDIAYAFSTTYDIAENLKIKYGYALASTISEDIFIDVASVIDAKTRQLSSRTLAEVIEPRYEEIFANIKSILEMKNCNNIVTSIILTGGSTKIKACNDLAQMIFGKPSKIGSIVNVRGADNFDNSYSSAVGLLLFSKNRTNHTSTNNNWRDISWMSKAKRWLFRI